MTLHVVNNCDPVCWQPLLAALADGDALLLIEDAVEAALPGHPLAPQLTGLVQRVSLHALTEDLSLRGIFGKISQYFAGATYHDFVAMSVAQDRVVNWR